MKKLWISFAVVLVVSFSVLGWIGTKIYQEMPPIPDQVIATDGTVVIPSGDIGRGQNVWQALGGMEVGSIWGHGSYVAPDWTADWLHREAMFVLEEWASRDFGKPYGQLLAEDKAKLRGRLEELYRVNTYDAATGVIRIDPARARAFESCLRHYADVFMKGHDAYAIPAGSVSTPERMRQFAAFMFWTSWTAATNGPTTSSPTPTTGRMNRWSAIAPPARASCGPASASSCCWRASAAWSGGTHRKIGKWSMANCPPDPLGKWVATPSQRATIKYFWVVSLLILVQILVGIVTAHYGVEGDGFYGIKIAKWLPYSVTRTWHVQLGIFWIATAWLAAGLFIGPWSAATSPNFSGSASTCSSARCCSWSPVR